MQYSQEFVNFIGAFLILIIGIIIGKVLGNTLRRVLRASEANKFFSRGLKLRFDVERFISIFISWLIYFITILLVLSQLGVSSVVIQIILLVVLVLIFLLVFLASKDFLPNLFAGIYLTKTKKIKIGDFIKIKGFEGIIVDFNLIETKIKTKQKEELFIPNSLLNKELLRFERK